jgi:2-amino-4-hydroxy-6-hydroxymethyldihydropteridine diphosphokinase
MPPTAEGPDQAEDSKGKPQPASSRLGKTVYLGLGSNQGARRAFLSAALGALQARGGAMATAVSSLYETDAVSDEPQPAYLNAVVRGQTLLSAVELLELCNAIEAGLGRVRPRDGRKPPRQIDIDILLYGREVIETPTLTVPHAALLARPFVLIPLAEVAEPGLVHPVTGVSLTTAAPSPQVRPFDARGSWP